MNFQERLADIRARMRDEKVALLVGMHDGAHFIAPNQRASEGGGIARG